jgi:hypothetical protein
MNMRNVRVCGLSILAIIIMALTNSSCTRFGEASIKLPTNPILTGGLGWAVVKDAYVRLKESPSETARDLDHLRRGGVFSLDARNLGSDSSGLSDKSAQGSPTVWYGINSEGVKGWVLESELDIYSSQAQAEKAAAAYR